MVIKQNLKLLEWRSDKDTSAFVFCPDSRMVEYEICADSYDSLIQKMV